MLVHCPDCGSKLQLKVDVPPGKKIKCPKCTGIFAPVADAAPSARSAVPPAPKARPKPKPESLPELEPIEEDEVEELQELEEAPPPKKRTVRSRQDEDDDSDDIAVPVRRPKRKKKRRSAFPIGIVLGLGGGLLATVLSGVLLFAFWPSRGGSHEATLREAIKLFDDFADIMESIKDDNSASLAVPRIESLADRMEQFSTKFRNMTKPSAAEDKRLEQKYKPEMEKAVARMMAAQMRVASIAGSNPKLAGALLRLGQSAQRMKPGF